MGTSFLLLPREIRLEIYELAGWLPWPWCPKLMYFKTGSGNIDSQDSGAPLDLRMYHICKTISQDLPPLQSLIAAQAIIPVIRFEELEEPYWTHKESDEFLNRLLRPAPILRLECNSALLQSPIIRDSCETNFDLVAWQKSPHALKVMVKFLGEALDDSHSKSETCKGKVIEISALFPSQFHSRSGVFYEFSLRDFHKLYVGVWNQPLLLRNLQTIRIRDFAGLMPSAVEEHYSLAIGRCHRKFRSMVCGESEELPIKSGFKSQFRIADLKWSKCW